MGIIRVGKKNPQAYLSGGFGASRSDAEKKVFSEDERLKLIESIKRMPKEKWVSALRSVGLTEDADECERSLAEEHLNEMRNTRLAEIMAMDEDDRLTTLVEEGFDEEAKELSQKLSVRAVADNADTTNSEQMTEDAGNGEENVGIEASVAGDSSELGSDEKPEKPKKRTYTRRSKKQ